MNKWKGFDGKNLFDVGCIQHFYNKDKNIDCLVAGNDLFNTEIWCPATKKSEIIIDFALQKDFKGKDIFVGDILSKKWKVEVYKNDEGTFMVRFHVNSKGNKPLSLKKYLQKRKLAGCEERDCIIIGNIYENPELLSV